MGQIKKDKKESEKQVTIKITQNGDNINTSISNLGFNNMELMGLVTSVCINLNNEPNYNNGTTNK